MWMVWNRLNRTGYGECVPSRVIDLCRLLVLFPPGSPALMIYVSLAWLLARVYDDVLLVFLTTEGGAPESSDRWRSRDA